VAETVARISQAHRQLRVSTKRANPEVFEANAVGVVPRELPQLLGAFPVFFVKNRDAQFAGARQHRGRIRRSQ
jgi:hypothetical protein